MTRTLRRRHLAMWCLLAPLGLLILCFALIWKPDQAASPDARAVSPSSDSGASP